MSKKPYTRKIEYLIGILALCIGVLYLLIAIPEVVTGYARDKNIFRTISIAICFGYNLFCLIVSGVAVVINKYRKPLFWYKLNLTSLLVLLISGFVEAALQSESIKSFTFIFLYGMSFYWPIILLTIFLVIAFKRHFTLNSKNINEAT
jgi:hypothetical protein